MERVTILEIAKIAGVAKSSVSKALNGKSGVAEETRRRILEIAAGFDFRPDAAAISLAKGRSGTLSLVIPAETGPALEGTYWASLIASAAEAAARRGLRLQILSPEAGAPGMAAFRDALRRRAVDGVIIADESLSPPVLEALTENGAHFVRLGGIDGPGLCSVDVDNRGGARGMTEFLISRGSRRIAFLAPPARYPYAAERTAGCSEALAAAGLPPPTICPCPYDARETRTAVGKLLSGACPDTVFIGAGGALMLGAVEGWRDSGGAASGTALAVFDDSPILDLIDPPVPAVRQPLSRIAEEAVDMLDALASGGAPRLSRVVLATELVER